MAGTFYPISQYYNDLAKSMNGLCHVYPSRFLVLNLEDPYEILQSIEQSEKAISELVTDNSIDYKELRKRLISAMVLNIGVDPDYSPDFSEPEDSEEPEAPAEEPTEDEETSTFEEYNYTGYLGDINFLSHDTQDGVTGADIYIEATREMSDHEYYVDLDRPVSESVFSMINTDEEKDYDFNVIVIFYNAYQVNPVTGGQTDVIIKDMPLGVYIPEEKVSIELSEEAYGSGSYCVRLFSDFELPDVTIEGDGCGCDGDNLEMTTRLITEFGEAIEVINEVHAEQKIAYDEIAAKLDSIKNLKNTPYIKDNAWYVNGRYIADVVTDTQAIREQVEAAVTRALADNGTLKELINNMVLESINEVMTEMSPADANRILDNWKKPDGVDFGSHVH